jgi:pyruvate/2-oxoglutarate dehydrogenase complex dihydrolipoamide acyltransferase (E2) component
MFLFSVAVGDTVQEDEEVCHIETDKTSIPVKAPCSGVITELCVGDGATVQPGAKLFIMSAGNYYATRKFYILKINLNRFLI